MVHANAPLSVQGRLRLVQRCQTRPVAHVAPEMGISRSCASKWVNRYRRYGEPRSTGPLFGTGAPTTRNERRDVAQIEQMRARSRPAPASSQRTSSIRRTTDRRLTGSFPTDREVLHAQQSRS